MSRSNLFLTSSGLSDDMKKKLFDIIRACAAGASGGWKGCCTNSAAPRRL